MRIGEGDNGLQGENEESKKKGSGIGYALAFGAGLAAGGLASEKAADYSAEEQSAKNWSETIGSQAQLTPEETQEMRVYEVHLANGEKTRVTLEQVPPVNINLEGSEVTQVNPENRDSDPTTVELKGSNPVRLNPHNADSDPVTVNLKGTERVRIDPYNPDSEPVTINLEGTKRVRIDPYNPDSIPKRIDL